MSENKTPRLAEILGVKVGQEFRIEGLHNIYKIDAETGNMEWRKNDNPRWYGALAVETLVRVINDPSLIRPVTQWTQDDIEDAKAVRWLYPEHEWVARDEGMKVNNTKLFVFKSKPVKRCDYFSTGVGANASSYYALTETVLRSVTWENSPVRIEDIING